MPDVLQLQDSKPKTPTTNEGEVEAGSELSQVVFNGCININILMVPTGDLKWITEMQVKINVGLCVQVEV